MAHQEVLTNGIAFNLTATLSALATTVTPPSYAGWPATGQFRVVIDSEILLITDASVHPWPVLRGQETTTAASHVTSAAVRQQMTAGAFAQLAQLPAMTSIYAWRSFE